MVITCLLNKYDEVRKEQRVIKTVIGGEQWGEIKNLNNDSMKSLKVLTFRVGNAKTDKIRLTQTKTLTRLTDKTNLLRRKIITL